MAQIYIEKFKRRLRKFYTHIEQYTQKWNLTEKLFFEKNKNINWLKASLRLLTFSHFL